MRSGGVKQLLAVVAILSLPVAAYAQEAVLSGTVTDSTGAVLTGVTRSGVELLVGQTAVINLQMAPGGVAEAVTVTGESPLLETTTSSLGGNVDPRQVQELPVNGRNWMALALLAPGSRTSSTNVVTPLPDRNGGEAREFQLNIDGQQVS